MFVLRAYHFFDFIYLLLKQQYMFVLRAYHFFGFIFAAKAAIYVLVYGLITFLFILK